MIIYSNPTGKAKYNPKIHSNNSEEDKKRERKKQKSSKTDRKKNNKMLYTKPILSIMVLNINFVNTPRKI